MALRKAVLAGVSAVALAVTGGVSAHAVVAPERAGGAVPIAEGGPGACSWNSRVTVTPGLTFSPKDFAFTMNGAIGPCTMPDGKVRTGTISVTKGTGNGGCGSAQVKTPFDVVWDDKTTSAGTASGVTSGPFGFVTGQLDSGVYKGTPFETFIFLNPQGPLQCGTSGVTAAELYGQITFH